MKTQGLWCQNTPEKGIYKFLILSFVCDSLEMNAFKTTS
uniref:Uncharacterized protein n=1 Tax=Moniliophthora roreri TaxID=221103 RepID=A0A0W0FI06_MONRR